MAMLAWVKDTILDENLQGGAALLFSVTGVDMPLRQAFPHRSSEISGM